MCRRQTCRANGRCRLPPMTPRSGQEALRGMVERVKFVEALGFDWVSVSEHHYSPRILTPSPVVSAAWLAARVDTIKIALLGPIVPVSNPIRVAEELCDARQPRARAHRGRTAARHHQRIPQLRPQPEGGARAHRRGDGADPEGVGRAAAVRLAGTPLPVSHRVDLAASAERTSADLCSRHQRGGGRIRRAPSHRSRRVLRHVRADGEGDRRIIASDARITAGSRVRTTSSTAPT